MNIREADAIREAAALSLSGSIQFPELIRRLASNGVERYHADYCRQEITYYLTSGESSVVASSHPQHPIAAEFSAAAVAVAVRESQRGEHTYADFVRKTMAAGCVGYFVQIVGQLAIYFGRNGDSHIERFPSASVVNSKVGGILESALSVGDVVKSAKFYERLFGFSRLMSTERLVALDVAGRDVLLLFLRGATGEPYSTPGGVIPPHGSSGQSHLAFSITDDNLADWKRRLESEGVIIESVVTWPGGAESVYFRDPDQNLLELITPGFWATY